MWVLTAAKIGLELGCDFRSVLGEQRLGEVGDRHFGRLATNHLWLCEGCGAHKHDHSDRDQMQLSFARRKRQSGR